MDIDWWGVTMYLKSQCTYIIIKQGFVNNFLIDPNFFSQFAIWKRNHNKISRFGNENWWNHLMNLLSIANALKDKEF